MLLLLLAGAATAYWVALRSATKAYDRALLDTSLAIAQQLTLLDGKSVVPLSGQARDVLLVDKFDQIFFCRSWPEWRVARWRPGLADAAAVAERGVDRRALLLRWSAE
jgi:two-component system sensor histidine kinase TctE